MSKRAPWTANTWRFPPCRKSGLFNTLMMLKSAFRNVILLDPWLSQTLLMLKTSKLSVADPRLSRTLLTLKGRQPECCRSLLSHTLLTLKSRQPECCRSLLFHTLLTLKTPPSVLLHIANVQAHQLQLRRSRLSHNCCWRRHFSVLQCSSPRLPQTSLMLVTSSSTLQIMTLIHTLLTLKTSTLSV